MFGQDTDNHARLREIKDEISKKIFSGWRQGKETPENSVSPLSFTPKRRADEDGDVLSQDLSRNQDIFTCQRWAVKRAHDLFRAMIANYALFEELHDLGKEKEQFRLKIIGSSVSGLSFAGMLNHIVQTWHDKNQDKIDLRSVLEIEFIDNHIRPLQRLLHARDRRIIPRFEYERLLTGESTELLRKDDEKDRAILRTVWNETDTLADSDAIEANCRELGIEYMPECLRWEAGDVRHVAQQILDGFEELSEGQDWIQVNQDAENSRQNGRSSTGGRIFSKVVPAESKIWERSIDRVHVQLAGEFSIASQPIGADYVLLATGPGVDISGLEGKPSTDSHTFSQNSQDSFWNTPKIDLDLVEADAFSVLVLGNGDSAAGAVYTTLLADAKACTYRFLSTLLKQSSEARAMFQDLREKIDSAPKGTTITDHWTNKLKEPAPLDALYGQPDGEHRAAIRAAVEEQLRSFVSVAVSVRAKDQHCIRPKWVEPCPDLSALGEDEAKEVLEKWLSEIPAFMSVRDIETSPADGDSFQLPTSPYLRSRMFSDCWPENRIALALMCHQFSIYQDNLRSDPDCIERKKTRERPVRDADGNTVTMEFSYRTPLFEIPVTDRYSKGEDPQKQVFKYVFDSRGIQFFALNGNHCEPA